MIYHVQVEHVKYLDVKGTKNLVSRAHCHICKWCILKSHHMHVISSFLFVSKNFIATSKNSLLKIVAHNKLELNDLMNCDRTIGHQISVHITSYLS
jgi:hypothetical protein